MTIPPFPSQDLAKLILGYLAEEQLMTTYDEFLQASPYLDVLRNEYDRIFMTSLKNILAEYRAVKIFVETCTPFSLRRKLFQCPNLLEVVKFLVENIDTNKIYAQEISKNKISPDKDPPTTTSKPKGCEQCHSVSLTSCTCESCHLSVEALSSQNASSSETTTLESSKVETTALSDLPGTHVTVRQKQVKFPNKDDTIPPHSQYNLTTGENSRSMVSNHSTVQNNVSKQNSYSSKLNNVEDNFTQSLPVKTADIYDATDKIEEFNDILNLVCNKNRQQSKTVTENSESKRISNAGTFQDFATGVASCGSSAPSNVPVTNITTNFSIQSSGPQYIQSGIDKDANYSRHVNLAKSQLHRINEGKIDNLGSNQSNETSMNTPNTMHLKKIKKEKITIISDVKVDASFNANNKNTNSQIKMPTVLKNATSTPLMQMQTILINGTSAYKQRPLVASTYSKDEIMAMPTIILVPSSGASKVTANNPFDGSTQALAVQPASLPTDPIKSSSTAQSITPLVVDVSSTNTVHNPKPEINCSMPDTDKEPVPVKIVDIKNASVPKENSATNFTETSTPQMLPLVRKSSSTPRRTSHVRVLDFTTPRRIFYETMKGGLSKQNDSSEELIISGSPKLNVKNLDNMDKSTSSIVVVSKENTGNKLTVNKYSNWDADLRALITADSNREASESAQKPKVKSRSRKRVRESTSTVKSREKDKIGEKKSNVKKKSPKIKRTKKKEKIEKEIEPPIVKEEPPADFRIKPTINIIPGNEWSTTPSTVECEKNKHNSEEPIDTPETEKNYLQNAIGAKLNISDLLETPYKQVLYDIQMETPKFLGPDVPGEPISDIKIMSIPTPRFLNTPKMAQGTPSSYSSRPTDYSSGGSYYKPDDQDYIPIPEDLGACTQPTNEKVKTDNAESSKNIDDCKEKINTKSRPVRQCTKNVSYYRSPYVNNKTKGVEEKIEIVSSSSDSINSSTEKQSDKVTNMKSIKDKSKLQLNTETKKKTNTCKKRKSPVRKETPKTFMKIKPRRTTPTKEVIGKSKKKLADLSQNHLLKSQTRKRTTSKEKIISATPVVVSAPTKSRRKSSTPRKLHCTKIFDSESNHNSPEEPSNSKSQDNVTQGSNILNAQDSDSEQLPLRWSDEGSQDVKLSEPQVSTSNETDEITKIREYIQTTVPNKPERKDNEESSLHINLIKRGFDVETAKIIERDLLDTPPQVKPTQISVIEDTTVIGKDKVEEPSILNKTDPLQDVTDDDEIELSVYECAQGGESFIVTHHDYAKELTTTTTDYAKLKDTYNMEICIEDGEPIRLRLSPFKMLFEQEPLSLESSDTNTGNQEQTKSNSDSKDMHKSVEDSLKVQYCEIIDSTVTNSETPPIIASPKEEEREITTTTEIVLEVEQINVKGKPEIKKRKRLQSGNVSDDTNENKRVKSEAQYLFSSAHMQNIDIESVLSKLHGP